MFYVYIYIDPRDDSPFYVGKGKGRRAFQHIQISKSDLHYKESNLLKVNKIRKILSLGLEPIIEIIHLESEELALKKEIELIKKYGRINNSTGSLTNLTDGGEGQSGWIPDNGYKKRMSESTSGEKNGMYNRKHSENTKKKMSEKATGRKHSNESKSEMSKNRKGEKNSFFGKFHSKESLEKISTKLKGKFLGENNKSSKKFLFISPELNEFIVFASFEKFCKNNGLSIGKMRRFLNKGRIGECKINAKNQTAESKNCIGWEVNEIQ